VGESRLAACRDHAEEWGWRIPPIHPGDPAGIRYRVGPVWALLGSGAIVLGVYIELAPPVALGAVLHAGLMLALGGIAFIMLSVGIHARFRRRHWVLVSAKVLDRELRLAATSDGRVWCWRLLCRFELDGRDHEVTPTIDFSAASSSTVATTRSPRPSTSSAGSCIAPVRARPDGATRFDSWNAV
jgi:hypothetical protein